MPRKKRGRKKSIKLKLKPDTLKSVFSIILLVLAGLTLLSFFVTGPTVNSKIHDGLLKTFGFASILVPFVLLVWGLLYFRFKNKYLELRVLLGLTALLFALSGIFHIFYSGDDALKHAQEGIGGGYVGYQLALILRNTVSAYGGFIILLAVVLIAITFIIDVPFSEILAKLGIVTDKAKSLKKDKTGKKSKEDTKKEDDDIKISTGTAVLANNKADLGAQQELPLEKVEDASFEVIPSRAEPMHSDNTEKISTDTGLSSIAAGLPYADKVWETPPLDLLNEPPSTPVDRGDVKARAKIIEDTLQSFGIQAKVVEVNHGPTVTRYAVEAAAGTKITKISSHQYDLALSLASPSGSVRIEAPIPGRSQIGIEVPNNTRVVVPFKEVYASDAMRGAKSPLSIVLGKDVGGQPMVYSINKMPHLLVAGATGSGKSIFLHSLMFSLLYNRSPSECKLILVDPKRVELVSYQDIPHLYTPVVTDIEKAPAVFNWARDEMNRRYKLFESAKARNIESYNEKSGFQALPYIVIVVDELGEIMVADPASVEKSIISIAQLARATGIHLILTTQRPSTNVVTGLIKANIPCRIAFNVTSNTDSRVIIDQAGAEKLTGKGDMLFVPPDASKPTRIQGTLVTEEEVNRLVTHLKGFGVKPEYKEEILEAQTPSNKSVSAGGDSKDVLFDEAVDIVTTAKKASASLLQRRLSIGYARAARILDELEAEGIVGPARGSKPREVLAQAIIEPELPELNSDDIVLPPTAPTLDQNLNIE